MNFRCDDARAIAVLCHPAARFLKVKSSTQSHLDTPGGRDAGAIKISSPFPPRTRRALHDRRHGTPMKHSVPVSIAPFPAGRILQTDADIAVPYGVLGQSRWPSIELDRKPLTSRAVHPGPAPIPPHAAEAFTCLGLPDRDPCRVAPRGA